MASSETVKDHPRTTVAHWSPNHPAVQAAARRAGVDAATYVREHAPGRRRLLLPAG